MRPTSSLAALAVVLAACNSPRSPVSRRSAPDAGVKAAPAEIPWIHDDWPAALAKARAEKRPIVVDLWAPWCHTCLSMRHFVLSAAVVAPVERFVWLEVNTEDARNAAFLTRYPVEVWPTYYVIDPADERVKGRWLGSASPDQFREFLRDGERAILSAAGLPDGDPLALLIAGDREAMVKNYAEAARKYAAAVAASPPGWPRRPDALVAQITMLWRAESWAACVDLGQHAMIATGNGVSAVDFTSFALACADELPEKSPSIEPMRRAGAERLRGLADDPEAELSADDRGEAYRVLWDTLEKLGDPEGAKAAAQKRLIVLERASENIPDAWAVTYDWARAETYLYLGRADDAIAMLTRREAAVPDDYNPPNYLARVYLRLGRHADAHAAIDRAIGRAYGPRKAAMLGLKADIYEAEGDRAAARAAVERQLAMYRELPEGQKQPTREAAVAARLEKLSKPPVTAKQ